jgi:hypothetical protein
MKLTISLPELEEGRSLQRGRTGRINELRILSERKDPVAVNPVRDPDGRMISLIRLKDEFEYHGEYSIGIKFRPVWNKTFTLCAARKDQLLALFMELEDGVYRIDKRGVREAKLTTKGNGCDPKVVAESEVAFSGLLHDHGSGHYNDIVQEAVEFIKRRY